VDSTQRKAKWKEAQDWYERSLATWKSLRNRGTVEKGDAEKIQRVEDELKKCSAALAQF